MGIFSHLREDELQAVAEYIKILFRKWRKVKNHAELFPQPEVPEWVSDITARKQHLEAGQKTFSTVCAACRGPEGDGKGPAAAALIDAAGDPAHPVNLRQDRLRSRNEMRDIYRVLLTGLNGTPMVSFADMLSDEQRWQLVAYIAQMREKLAAKGST